MDNKKYDRLTKSLVYPLIEKYYSSGDLPSVFYKREGLSESQFYTWRQRYLRDHPSVAKKLGVAFKPARTPSRPPQTRVHRSPCACPLLCGSGNRPLNLPMSPPSLRLIEPDQHGELICRGGRRNTKPNPVRIR